MRMATDFDPYAILQVERSAGQDEIDQAYRRQWAAYPGDPTPEARLREIQAAYRILSDPEERRAYDSRLAERSADGATWAMEPELATSPAPTLHGDGPGRVPWGVREILLAIAVVVGGVILASIPIFLLADWVAGDKKLDEDPNALAIQLVASAFFQFAAFGAAWWFSVRKFRLNWSALGLRRPVRGMPWLPFSLAAGALLVVGVYGVLLDAAGIHPDTELPDAVFESALPLGIVIVLTVAVAPVVEEVFFRGFVFSGLTRRWGPVWGVVASSSLWGAAHLGNSGYLYVVPPIVMIGAMFAWGYHYSKSILPSIGAHFLFNLLQVIGTLATR
jgi:membrane protease YdiL (CAAX protease family)